MRAHSCWASLLPLAPGSETNLTLRLPVRGSRVLSTAYHLPLPRSRTCPFIILVPRLQFRDRATRQTCRNIHAPLRPASHLDTCPLPPEVSIYLRRTTEGREVQRATEGRKAG